MMKWLFFTKSDGSISCLRFNKSLKHSKTLAPQGSNKFQVIDDSDIDYPENPIYKNGKYIDDGDKKKDKERISKKERRINKLNKTTVEVDGKLFQARESDELYIRGKIARLADGETTRWILDNNNVTTVTKEQLIQVLNKGFDEGQAIFDEYMDALEAQGRIE